MELSRPIYENALTGIDASCFPDYNIVTGRNVNATTIKNYGKVLDFLTKKGKGIVPYSFLYSSCSTHTGLALNLSGIPTLFLHPYTVQASVWLWNNGITPSLINNSYHLQNYR